jgi:hypothetical protein
MSRVVLEPTTPAFEGTKTIHDLDSEAIVIGILQTWSSVGIVKT